MTPKNILGEQQRKHGGPVRRWGRIEVSAKDDSTANRIADVEMLSDSGKEECSSASKQVPGMIRSHLAKAVAREDKNS